MPADLKAVESKIRSRFSRLDAEEASTMPKPVPQKTVTKTINLDELSPRIGLTVGVTLPIGDYRTVRADAGLTISRPKDMTTEETFEWLESALMDKVESALDKLEEMLNGYGK